MEDILRLLEKDGKLSSAQIAAMIGSEQSEVEEKIKEYEDSNIILGYNALVDWDSIDDSKVTALIEVKVAPQRGDGYDRIARRIDQYDEVESVYLMSGSFDLAVFIKGKSLKDVAYFVSAHLAPLDGVTGTATHFLLKKYKEKYRTFGTLPEQKDTLRYL